MPLSAAASGADHTGNKVFVHSIRRRPCIYNFNHDDHSRRDAVEAAWRDVAHEAQDTVKNCKFRWKNLRTAFSRSVKQRTRYYLEDTMQFVVPFLKPRQPSSAQLSSGQPSPGQPSPGQPSSAPGSESDYLEERDIEVTTVYEADDLEPDEQKYSATINFNEQLGFQEFIKPAINNNSAASSEANSPNKNSRNLENHRHDHHYSISKQFNASDEDNADVDFLKSLLPDIQCLNRRQKIKLKRRFLEVMEEVLYEDVDTCKDSVKVKRNGGQSSGKFDK